MVMQYFMKHVLKRNNKEISAHSTIHPTTENTDLDKDLSDIERETNV